MNHYECPELLQELFQYNPDTGRITHRRDRRKVKAGTPADTSYVGAGYSSVSVRLNGRCRNVSGHRAAWILHHRKPIPSGLVVDHINGDKRDNRICNLRLVTQTENMHNRKPTKGYSWKSRDKGFHAQISVNSKVLHLGLHDTELDARAAYLRAKRQFHPSAPIQ